MFLWTGICFFLLLPLAKADCDADVEEYFQGLNPSSPKMWSLEMFDSSTKHMTDGYLEISFIYQLANFDECVAVAGPNGDDGSPRFTGQYCQFSMGYQLLPNASNTFVKALKIQHNLQRISHIRTGKTMTDPFVLPSVWAVCAPSTCGKEGVKRIADFNVQFYAASLGLKANTTMLDNTCYHENDGSNVLDAGSWSFIVFAALLVLVICVSTILESFSSNFKLTGWKAVVNAFSLKQTLVKDLLKLPKTHAPGHLGCLHGLRTMSMLWIILCHTYSNAGGFPLVNYISYTSRFTNQWFMAPILNGYVAVDTFFVLSGLLTVYVPMMEEAKGRKFNVFKYYLYRYLRITIPFAVVTWFVSTASIYIGKGPLWFLSFRFAKKLCQENWWVGLLYVANYFRENCIGQTWYLCVDMQLALLAPLIIYPLMKWPKYGLAVICLLTLGSIAAVFAVIYVENLPWTLLLANVETSLINRYWDIIYENTPMRASPYLIGMALGYVLSRKARVPLPSWGVAIGWLASTALALSVIFLIIIPYSEAYEYEPLAAAFYGSLHRPAWAVSICWIIWACVNGYGGIVDEILSWKYFVPMSKLTFSAFLTHLASMAVYMGLRRVPFYVSHFQTWFLFGSFIILIIPYTLFIYLAVEAPLMSLMRLAFKKRTVIETATSRIDKIIGKKA